MQTIHDLYLQSPFWVWLALGAVFVALDMATATGKFIWPAAAAAALACVDLTPIRLGLPIEASAFVAASAAGLALSFGLGPRKRRPSPPEAARPLAATPTPSLSGSDPTESTGRLIGRIGRSTGEFVDGVGRVRIDDAEWGAEADPDAEGIASEATVRVMGVKDGARLRVRRVG
jgi:membrane protein implicated in regulation of membrane protease activity